MDLTLVGQFGLLAALVMTGHAASACIAGRVRKSSALRRSGSIAAVAGTCCLTGIVGILAYALVVKDFRFAYVADYSSHLLSWQYSLSALWVGQAGSLLLWAWMSAVAAMLFRWTSRSDSDDLRELAFGLLMGLSCFLVGAMVFAADPMKASLVAVQDGSGLSPILQHPSMLIHPPIVFLGYAVWAIPFALAVAALITGRLDGNWLMLARPWMLIAWLISGCGIFLGAQWAYQELGWGGYWSWDPVENGSLIPWLLGTAAIHATMVWRHRGMLKKTTIVLAIATFAACNFATFLTRSGIFSSLHAFSQSPIGWLFLGQMILLSTTTGLLLFFRRRDLRPVAKVSTLWCRESMVTVAIIALSALAVVITVGTVSTAISDALLGRKVFVGPEFYNLSLMPVAIVVLLTTAVAPLTNWKVAPNSTQRRLLAASALLGTVVAALVYWIGLRHGLALAVAATVALGVGALLSSVWLDGRKIMLRTRQRGTYRLLSQTRRQYGGYVIHLGLLCAAVGVAGSSLGTDRIEVNLTPGESIPWGSRTVRLTKVTERELPDRLVAEVELEVTSGDNSLALLRPAQHYHRLSEEWTSEVAIWSTWSGDLYVILHGGDEVDGVRLTVIDNPGMRWLWMGGWIMAAGSLIAWWPSRRRVQVEVAPVESSHVGRRLRLIGLNPCRDADVSSRNESTAKRKKRAG